MATRRPFLTAQWRSLVMLNFETPSYVLRPHLPAGVELDTYHGRSLVSIVAFHFLDARLGGWRVPGHQHFVEVNLRAYVRRTLADGTVRRGVTFLKEIVPRWLVSTIANCCFGQSFLTRPMRSRLDLSNEATGGGVIEYELKHRGRWNRLHALTSGAAHAPEAGSEAEFITEHYWSYTRLGSHRTMENHVEHDPWRVFDLAKYAFDFDVGQLYGLKWLPFLKAEPTSAFVADGSAVQVYPGEILLEEIRRPRTVEELATV